MAGIIMNTMLHIKVSEMSPKSFAHSRVGSVGSCEMAFFGVLKVDPQEPCGNVFLFCPQV